MASVTQARQTDKPKTSVPVEKPAPSQYQVETGQAVHRGEMSAAKTEGGKKGAVTGLTIGGGLASAALPYAAAAGLPGMALLAAGLGTSALLGWAFGSGAAVGPERERQKTDAKRGDIAALSGQAQSGQVAKAAKERRASETRAGKKPSTGRIVTPDEQLVQATSLSGANTSQDAWHTGVYGSGRSV